MFKKKRRRTFLINRFFQWRLAGLLLGLVLLATITNLLFMWFVLYPSIEDQIYRSHFLFQTLNEVLLKQIVQFNLILFLLFGILSILAYSWIRIRLKRYFNGMELALKTLKTQIHGSEVSAFPPTFGEHDKDISNFFSELEGRMIEEQRFCKVMMELVSNPGADRLKNAQIVAQNKKNHN